MPNNKQVKVLVGIPTLGEIKTQTTASLIQYLGMKQHQSVIVFREDSQLHTARNSFVWDAVSHKADYVMMIDSDVVFPPHAIDHLIAEDKDIISGLYYGRIAPFPVVKDFVDGNIRNPRNVSPQVITEVGAVGGGFLLIKMDVFKKLEPPFFYFGFPQEFGLNEISGPQKDIDPDVTFCLKARKAGFKVFVDSHFELGHVGKRIYNWEDNLDWQKTLDKDFK